MQNSRIRPKAILFDHDGVLVTSEELHLQAWNQLLHELSIPYSELDFSQYIGMHAPRIMTLILNRFRSGWSPQQYDVDALARRKNDLYLEIARTQLALYPGVREGLEWLRSNGIAAAIVSNAKRRELQFSVETLQLKDYFGAIISRDDALRPKPDPSPYELGALSLGFTPGECLAIDDTPTGLESAQGARCRIASVTTNYREIDLKTFPLEWIGPEISRFFAYVKALPLT